MPTAFEVVGPFEVQISAPDDAGAWTELGRTPNRQRPSFEYIVHTEELGSNEFGDEAEQIVYTGSRGILQFTLTKWDETVLNDLLQKVVPVFNGTPDGQFTSGEIGALFVNASVAASFLFGVRLTPSSSVAPSGLAVRTFPSCYLEGAGAVRQFDMGNTGTMLSMTCQVRRSSGTAIVPTGTAPTADHELLVKGTTS